MNKGEFIKAIAEKAGVTNKVADAVFAGMVDTITETLKSGDKIALTGFASFELKVKPAREGINPATKAKIKIAASKNPTAKFGKAYKTLFN